LDPLRIAEVPADRHASEVMAMCLECFRIEVCAEDDFHAGVLEAEAHASRAGEQVSREQWPRRGPAEPPGEFDQLLDVVAVISMWRQPEGLAAIDPHRGVGRLRTHREILTKSAPPSGDDWQD